MIKRLLSLFSKKVQTSTPKVETPQTLSVCPSKLKKGQIIISEKREFVVKGISPVTKKRINALDFGPQITIHLMDLKYQNETSEHYLLRYKPTCCVKVA